MKVKDGKAHRYAKLLVYGCQMNVSDAERMEGQLETIGYEPTEEMTEADLILINTCCVRESAEDRVYGKIGEIKHLKEKNPALIFGITGCMAQKEGEALIRRAPHIDFVLGTNKVHELTRVVQEIAAERGHVVDVQPGETELPEGGPVARQNKFSVWVPIMYGCNNFCTYCIVPYVRGRERSRRPEDVVAEVREAVRQGAKEVTLLGQNVNSYGKDHKLADFADLLKMVDAVPGIERVRFMTSHPKDLSDKLIETIRTGRHICEHIHLPVQSGSDRILRAMNRGYTAEKYLAQVDLARKYIPNLVLTTDVIVGFPGETEEDFLDTLALTEKVRFDSMFTFIYSRRPGTPAAKIEDDTPRSVIQNRFDRLVESAGRVSAELHRAQEGKTFRVLIDGTAKNGDYTLSARTAGGRLVHLRGDESLIGSWANARIVSSNTFALFGEITE